MVQAAPTTDVTPLWSARRCVRASESLRRDCCGQSRRAWPQPSPARRPCLNSGPRGSPSRPGAKVEDSWVISWSRRVIGYLFNSSTF